MHTPTEDDFLALLRTHPKLCACGYNYNYRNGLLPSGSTPESEFRKHRTDLVESFQDVVRAMEWLAPIETTRKTGSRRSSYHLKHVMEEQTGIYVTNGVFIAAALLLSIPVDLRLCDRGVTPNPHIGLKRRSYLAAARRHT